MQVKLVERDEPERESGTESWVPPERRQLVHKRVERWIRLQTFVYGLPEDYSYAVRVSDEGGRCESHVLVNVGWMSWFGAGEGPDRQQALAAALLETEDALSANGSRVFLHRVSRRFRRFFGLLSRFQRRPLPLDTPLEAKEVEEEGDLLAS